STGPITSRPAARRRWRSSGPRRPGACGGAASAGGRAPRAATGGDRAALPPPGADGPRRTPWTGRPPPPPPPPPPPSPAGPAHGATVSEPRYQLEFRVRPATNATVRVLLNDRAVTLPEPKREGLALFYSVPLTDLAAEANRVRIVAANGGVPQERSLVVTY